MLTCKADPTIKRVALGTFQFPLGAYPVEALVPRQGYSVTFEPADGDDTEGEWEEWPDRYVYDVVISAERVEPLCRMLFSLLQGRVYPILDVLGHDAYREIDPYISYDLVGLDRFTDAVRRFRDFLYEDGMCGFGAMSEEPFFYIFIDEHKILTLRCEPTIKDKVEKILAAFDLEAVDEPAGADAAAHEHRGVLAVPADNPDLLSQEEIIERLKEDWQLLLNVDPDTNRDDDGIDLGITAWRVIIRCEYEDRQPRYAEVLLDASNLREAEELSFDAVDDLLELTPPDAAVGGGAEPKPLAAKPADLAPTSTPTAPTVPTPPTVPPAAKVEEEDEDADPDDTPPARRLGPDDEIDLDMPFEMPGGPAQDLTWEDAVIVAADRVTAEVMSQLLIAAQAPVEKKVRGKAARKPVVRSSRWVQ